MISNDKFEHFKDQLQLFFEEQGEDNILPSHHWSNPYIDIFFLSLITRLKESRKFYLAKIFFLESPLFLASFILHLKKNYQDEGLIESFKEILKSDPLIETLKKSKDEISFHYGSASELIEFLEKEDNKDLSHTCELFSYTEDLDPYEKDFIFLWAAVRDSFLGLTKLKKVKDGYYMDMLTVPAKYQGLGIGKELKKRCYRDDNFPMSLSIKNQYTEAGEKNLKPKIYCYRLNDNKYQFNVCYDNINGMIILSFNEGKIIMHDNTISKEYRRLFFEDLRDEIILLSHTHGEADFCEEIKSSLL